MNERKLKEYFENLVTVDQLALDIKDSRKKTGYDVDSIYVDTISTGEFEVKKEHLIKLCNDTLNGKLSPSDINSLAFALIASDFFNWDNETPDGKIISEIIFDWDNPDIGFDLTFKNIELWKEYLLTGIYKLDKEELKEKIRRK
jgi:hypothetical protein